MKEGWSLHVRYSIIQCLLRRSKLARFVNLIFDTPERLQARMPPLPAPLAFAREVRVRKNGAATPSNSQFFSIKIRDFHQNSSKFNRFQALSRSKTLTHPPKAAPPEAGGSDAPYGALRELERKLAESQRRNEMLEGQAEAARVRQRQQQALQDAEAEELTCEARNGQ